MSEKVLLVTQHYRPEQIGSAPYCVDIAEWLAGRGWDVTVLTGLPHYPDPQAFAAFNATAAPREQRQGLVIERLRSWLPKRRSAALRIASEMLFLLAGVFALLRRRIPRHPLVISLCPSIFTVALGQLMRRRDGSHVAVVHDIQSGLAGGLGMVRFGLLLRCMRWFERLVLNRTDAVCVLSAEMRMELRRIGVTVPIEVLPIWIDTDMVRPAGAGAEPARTVLYSGNLGRKQGLDQIIDLAERLQQQRPDLRILVRGAGGEREAFAATVAGRGLGNIGLLPLLPRERLAEGLAEGDVHLVPQNPEAADFAVPSKIYGIMAAGRSFIATANPGSPLWYLQQQSGAFLCVPPNDPAAFAAAVTGLLDDPGRRRQLERAGRDHVERHHATSVVLGRLERLLDMLLRDGTLAGRRQSLLVLEPDRDGHPYEWLLHLIQGLTRRPDIEQVWFVVAPELHQRLAENLPPEAHARIRLIALNEDERRLCCHPALILSGFARWWMMRRYLRRTGADSGYFLSLDHLSLPLAFGLGAFGRRLGGILFRPSVHYGEIGSYRPTWTERIRDLRKAVLYRLMLMNRGLHVVLSLDPFFPDYAGQYYRGGHKVMALPDPAYPPPAAGGAAQTLIQRLPAGRTVFLMFGFMTHRKGLLHLAEALRHLDAATAGKIAIVIAGEIAPGIRAAFSAQFAAASVQNPGLWLHTEARWLDSAEIAALVARSDVVLAPYQRFVGSSGVLLWAARHGKPLLTQDYGLIGRLVSEFSLGLTADVTNPRRLADAITEMTLAGPETFIDRQAAELFVAGRTPEAFADQVFSSVGTS